VIVEPRLCNIGSVGRSIILEEPPQLTRSFGEQKVSRWVKIGIEDTSEGFAIECFIGSEVIDRKEEEVEEKEVPEKKEQRLEIQRMEGEEDSFEPIDRNHISERDFGSVL